MTKKQTQKSLHVYRKLLKNSIEITIDKKKYRIDYPDNIWGKFNKQLHKMFADNLTYAVTWHMALIEKRPVVYHFDHPVVEPLFFKLLMYSIPMNIYVSKKQSLTSLIRSFYNASYITEFKSLNHFYVEHQKRSKLNETALLLFSFGKDSLLTFALLNELRVKSTIMFMEEPQSKYENIQKRKLVKKFLHSFKYDVDFFPISFGHIRQNAGVYWGWDIILSQYILMLIPYCFYYRAKYIFLGNEQSCNSYTVHRNGFFINPVFEQSVKAMQILQDIPKLFSIKTHLGSIIEPIHEIFITQLLHRRYPKIASFQTSCFLESHHAKKRRWCGNCEKCARMYIFFKALQIDPFTVGFDSNTMLSIHKKHLYTLFQNTKETSAFGGSGIGKDEQLLAFYLAYLNGTRGDIMKEYKKRYHQEAHKRRFELINTYFGIHSSLTLPPKIRKRVLSILHIEQKIIIKKILPLANL